MERSIPWDKGPQGMGPIESMTARALLLFTALLGSASAQMASAQTSAPTAETFFWTVSGPTSGINMGALVVARPSSSVQLVAQQLGSRPAGSRGLVLEGFAEDLTTLDFFARARGGAVYPSPWVDKGVMSVAVRVKNWMQALETAGASVDFVLVRCTADRSATVFDPYGAPAWFVIQADPRFAAVKAAIGSQTLPAEMASNLAMRAKWDEYFSAETDRALSRAVAQMVHVHFPSAAVVAENRYSLPESGGVTLARAGGKFGTHDQPQFFAQGVMLQPFSTLAALVADAREIAGASERAVVPSVASPSWEGDAQGASAFMDSAYWYELVTHMAISGAKGVILDRGELTRREASELASTLAAVYTRTGNATPEPFQSSAEVDPEVAVASAMLVGQTVFWRVSFAPGVSTVRVTYYDNSIQNLLPEADSSGAWFSHGQEQQIAYIGLPPTGNSGGGSGGEDSGGGDSGGGEGSGDGGGDSPPAEPSYIMLYDNEPHHSFVAPVAGTTKYLAVYQNNADFNAQFTGLINPALVIADIQRQINAGWDTEWGMLDFEVPFDAILLAGPSDPRYEATMASMVTALQEVQAAFPHIKWTYYGVPNVLYWVLGKDWGYITEEQREGLYPQVAANFAPLLNQVDWVMPSVYDVYERGLGWPPSWSGLIASEREWRKACVTTVIRYYQAADLPCPPILPAVSAWFQPSGHASVLLPIPIDEFCEDQVHPCLEAGADGIALWGAMEYYLTLATDDNLPPGYEGATGYTRFRFALDYYGTYDVNTVNWYAPATFDFIGGYLNQTLSTALQVINNGGTPLAPGSQ
jgi:uncharacterized membrane protein YgcG